MRVRISVLFLLFLCVFTPGFAVEINHRVGANFAYYFADNQGEGLGSNSFLLPSYIPRTPPDGWTAAQYPGKEEDKGRNLGNTWGSLELEGYYRFTAFYPLLQGSGLFAGNGLTLSVSPVFSPVSLHADTQLTFQPIAFFKLHTRFSLGTGWPLDLLGIHGLALNTKGDGTKKYVGGLAAFWGIGATLQFDLGAVIDSPWAHVVFSLSSSFQYKAFSGAKEGDPWVWRGDGGQNFNGWYYGGSYAVGWQPPWKVTFIGFFIQHSFFPDYKKHPQSWTVAGGGWGSDYHSIGFGPLVNIDMGKDNSLTIIFQLQRSLLIDGMNRADDDFRQPPNNSRDNDNPSLYNSYFLNRTNAEGRSFVKMSRIAISWSKKL